MEFRDLNQVKKQEVKRRINQFLEGIRQLEILDLLIENNYEITNIKFKWVGGVTMTIMKILRILLSRHLQHLDNVDQILRIRIS